MTPVLVVSALCAAGVVLALFRAAPRLAVVIWFAVLCLLPIWVGVTVGPFWSAIALVTIAAVATNVANIRFVPADALVAAFALVIAALYALDMATLSDTLTAVLEWIIPYVWGRLVLARVSALFLIRVIAVAAVVVAVLAVLEFVTGKNLFVLIPGPGPDWTSLQPRGGFIRAEGAFGHSIALGASLAMSTAFVVSTRWPLTVIVGSTIVVGAAVVFTFSRIGLVTFAGTLALSVLLLPRIRTRVRVVLIALLIGAAVVVLPFIDGVFAEAGSEADGSADYRGDLFSLVGVVRLMGAAESWTGSVVDGVYLGTYANSIDNTYLLMALRFGWIPTALIVVALLLIIASLLRRRGNPAAIAVAVQAPALLAAAPITQFGTYFWFLTGLAVAWRLLAVTSDGGREGRSGDASLTRPVAAASA